MKQGTLSRGTGTTLRDGVGREGGGVQEGDTCTPMANSRQCMEKKHYNTIKQLASNENK